MGIDREKRLQGGPKERALDDVLDGALRDEHLVARPGKRTLIEQHPDEHLADVAGSRFAVGRRTLLERYVQHFPPPALEPCASIMDPAVSPPPVARPVLDDFRSRSLHEVLTALSVMRGRRGLMDATRSAATRATRNSRPALPSLTVRPAPPDPDGQAMWRAAERRAATLYRHAVESGEISATDPAIEAALARAGAGRPLPADVRREMELELATPLDRVRIHTDSVAADAARAVRAEAFTVGEDIFFADGAYAPETPAGQRLLAHELTHVVQAYQGRAETGGAGIKVSSPGEALEREADAVADRIGDSRVAPEAAPKPALASSKPAPALSSPAGPARVMRKPAIPGRTFAEPSSPVGELGRVQAPEGVFLRVQPAPDAASPIAPIPFNGLVYVERRTTQARASERWCYVVATEIGAAGFCEERYLALDPPEPTAQLRRTQKQERLAVIAEEAYGLAKDANNSRLYVQALYLANRGRAGVKLEHVDLGFWARALRGGGEEETLEVYKGATVREGHSIWIPSKAFIAQLQAAGAVTGGSTYVMDAWHRTKDFAGDVADGVKYAAGFIVGILEGAFTAVVDLFKGAAEVVEAVLEVIWSLVTGNPGRIRDMLMGWVAKMRLAWAHRGQLADEFLKKWNADGMWDRGLFQGEVLGWVMMTVLLILVTMGEAAPVAVSGIALRWPQLTRLLQTVDTLGDVTTYLGAAAKTVQVPRKAVAFVSGKLGKAKRIGKEGCFIAGTLVWTPHGVRAIEQLTVGMRVTAADVETRQRAHQAIMQTFVHMVPVVIDLRIGTTTITASSEHPFHLVGHGWQPAGRLVVGDRLLTAAGEEIVLTEVTRRTGSFAVFNITVEALATYHVSPLGVLVHNKPAKLDLQVLFNDRKQGLFDSIDELRKRLADLRTAAKTNDQLAALKKLEHDISALERQARFVKLEPLPAGADLTASRFDPLSQPEQLESNLYKQMDKLEKSIKPKIGIPDDRPALDAETVLASGKGNYTLTGKTFQGRKIYKDTDGRFYYVDNLHKGAASEIEVFSPNGEHLGTMSPDGVFNATGKVKGRVLKKEHR